MTPSRVQSYSTGHVYLQLYSPLREYIKATLIHAAWKRADSVRSPTLNTDPRRQVTNLTPRGRSPRFNRPRFWGSIYPWDTALSDYCVLQAYMNWNRFCRLVMPVGHSLIRSAHRIACCAESGTEIPPLLPECAFLPPDGWQTRSRADPLPESQEGAEAPSLHDAPDLSAQG